jgi:glucose/arabinose dehydrogenase
MQIRPRTLATAAATAIAGLSAAAGPATAHIGHCSQPPTKQLSGSGLTLTQVAFIGQLTDVVADPAGSPDRLYVTERVGRVSVVDNGQARPFLDLTAEVQPTVKFPGNEAGMQSVAFAPDYRTSRLLYVFYSDANGDSRVDEFRATPDFQSADMTTRRRILFVEHSFADRHYGGQLLFGPRNRLFISLGEGTRPHYAQQEPLYGRIVSVDPRRPRKSRTQIAKGMRNPFHFTFDPFTRDLVVADVGQDTDEEIDVIPPRRFGKANLGWPYREGNRRLRAGKVKNYVRPAITYDHEVGTAVIGGRIIRDPRLPGLRGRFVYADFCDAWIAIGRLHRKRPSWTKTGIVTYAPTAFGEDSARRLYVASSSGELYRIDPEAPSGS